MTLSTGPGQSARRVGRPRRDRVLLVLFAVIVLAAGPRCAGSGGDEGAVLVSTLDLWSAPERYEGRRVRTTGVVRGLSLGEASEHFVLEGPQQSRVELRGVDRDELEAMLGRRAEVVGRFHFTESDGFGIEVETIRVVG